MLEQYEYRHKKKLYMPEKKTYNKLWKFTNFQQRITKFHPNFDEVKQFLLGFYYNRQHSNTLKVFTLYLTKLEVERCSLGTGISSHYINKTGPEINLEWQCFPETVCFYNGGYLGYIELTYRKYWGGVVWCLCLKAR